MIQALVRRGVYHKDIAAELGVSPKTVSRALSRGSAPRGRRRRRVNKLDGQAPVVSSATNSGPSSVFPASTSSQSRASPAGQASWLAGRGYPLNQSRFPPVGFRRVSAKLHWPLPTRLVRLPSSHEHRASPQLPNSLALRAPLRGLLAVARGVVSSSAPASTTSGARRTCGTVRLRVTRTPSPHHSKVVGIVCQRCIHEDTKLARGRSTTAWEPTARRIRLHFVRQLARHSDLLPAQDTTHIAGPSLEGSRILSHFRPS